MLCWSCYAMNALIWTAVLIASFPYWLNDTESKEVCHNEFFTAKCPEDHVILMTSSLYGRMRSGRCVKTSFGYTGCYADVLDHTHERCSGRQYCQIKVPDASMDTANPCNDDLISYLDANFTCIKDTKSNDSNCRVLLTTNDPGYLVINDDVTSKGIPHIEQSPSPPAIYQPCGTEFKPWLIQAQKGQQVNLTLYDFTPYLSLATGGLGGPSRNDILSGGFYALQSICTRTIVFKDSNRTGQIVPCRFSRFASQSVTRRRESHIHLTNLNQVQLHSTISESPPAKYDPDFLKGQEFFMNLVVKYEAVGCPDVMGSEEGGKWMKREFDRLIVGCSETNERWEIACQGNQWMTSQDFNCSVVVNKPVKTKSSSTFLPLGASIFVVVIMSVTVGLMVLLMGICFMRRRKFCSVVDQAKDQKMMREMKLISTSDLFKRPISYSSTADVDICDTSYDNAANSNPINKNNLIREQRSKVKNVQPSCINLLPVKPPPCKVSKSLKATVADCCNDNARNREALMHYEYVWQANAPEQQQASSSKVVNNWKGEQETCCPIASSSCQRLVPQEMHHRHHHQQQQQQHRYHQMQVPTVVFLQTGSDSRPDLLRLTSTARTNTFYNTRDAAACYRSLIPGTLQVNLTTSFEESIAPNQCKNDPPIPSIKSSSTAPQQIEPSGSQETRPATENVNLENNETGPCKEKSDDDYNCS